VTNCKAIAVFGFLLLAASGLAATPPDDEYASKSGVRVRRFPISPATPHCAQMKTNRMYQHCWFFPRFGDVDAKPGLELFYIKGTAEHTAYSHRGELLWRWSDPKKRPSAVRVDTNVPIFDLDGDGRLDLIVFRHYQDEKAPRLCRLDAATGKTIAWSPEPLSLSGKHGDTRLSLIPARLGGKRWSLVLHDDYAQIIAFDADLKRIWTRPITGLGHTTEAVDLDRDGVDELYCGVALLDAAGKAVWNRSDLLKGTGEWHPDTNPIVMSKGAPRLFFGPGARMLDAKGKIIWSLKGERMTEVQSARVLHRRDGDPSIVLTDLPAKRTLTWRGMRMRSIDSVSYFLDPDLQVVGRGAGCHVPITGDWTGDGNDELILLDKDLRHLLVIGSDAKTIARIPIQQRVYVSDIRTAPILPGSKGDQIIMHQWSADWRKAYCVIIENTKAAGRLRKWDQIKSARWTAY